MTSRVGAAVEVILTPRQREVFALAKQGLTNRQIASELGISPNTVAAHMGAVRRKLDDAAALNGEPAESGHRRSRARRPLGLDPNSSADLNALLDEYEGAFQQLMDAHLRLFSEKVRIVVDIGHDDGGDRVVEQHWTSPRQWLPLRFIRPLVSRDEATHFSDLSLSYDVPDERVDISIVPVPTRLRGHRVLLLFQPGLRDETEWVIRYDSPALWRPLRETGRDYMTWATGTTQSYRRAPVRDLEVEFVFPRHMVGMVSEESGRGTVEEKPSDDGRHLLSWRISGSESALYRWELSMSQLPD